MTKLYYGKYLEKVIGIYHAFLTIDHIPKASVTGTLVVDGVRQILSLSDFTADKGCRGRNFHRILYPDMIIVPNIKLTQDGGIIREGINPEYSLAEILDFIAQNSDPLFVATFQSSKK